MPRRKPGKPAKPAKPVVTLVTGQELQPTPVEGNNNDDVLDGFALATTRIWAEATREVCVSTTKGGFKGFKIRQERTTKGFASHSPVSS